VDWTPVLWSHFFEANQERKEKIKILSVLETIQTLEERFSKVERIKNGKLIIGSGNSDLYRALRNSLTRFTQEKYNRKFSTFHFEDIDSQFFEEYAFSLQNH
jgi:hypothetical protein